MLIIDSAWTLITLASQSKLTVCVVITVLRSAFIVCTPAPPSVVINGESLCLLCHDDRPAVSVGDDTRLDWFICSPLSNPCWSKCQDQCGKYRPLVGLVRADDRIAFLPAARIGNNMSWITSVAMPLSGCLVGVLPGPRPFTLGSCHNERVPTCCISEIVTQSIPTLSEIVSRTWECKLGCFQTFSNTPTAVDSTTLLPDTAISWGKTSKLELALGIVGTILAILSCITSICFFQRVCCPIRWVGRLGSLWGSFVKFNGVRYWMPIVPMKALAAARTCGSQLVVSIVEYAPVGASWIADETHTFRFTIDGSVSHSDRDPTMVVLYYLPYWGCDRLYRKVDMPPLRVAPLPSPGLDPSVAHLLAVSEMPSHDSVLQLTDPPGTATSAL